MWVPIMAGISLVVIVGSLLMGAFGNPQQRQQGMQNQAQYIGAGAGSNYGTSSRGVGAPNQTVSIPIHHR